MNPTSPSQRALNAANAIFQVRADGLISIPESLQKLTSRAEVFQAVALLIDDHCPPQEPIYGIWGKTAMGEGAWVRVEDVFVFGPKQAMTIQATFFGEQYVACEIGPDCQPIFPSEPAPLTREEEAEECLNRR